MLEVYHTDITNTQAGILILSLFPSLPPSHVKSDIVTKGSWWWWWHQLPLLGTWKASLRNGHAWHDSLGDQACRERWRHWRQLKVDQQPYQTARTEGGRRDTLVKYLERGNFEFSFIRITNVCYCGWSACNFVQIKRLGVPQNRECSFLKENTVAIENI